VPPSAFVVHFFAPISSLADLDVFLRSVRDASTSVREAHPLRALAIPLALRFFRRGSRMLLVYSRGPRPVCPHAILITGPSGSNDTILGFVSRIDPVRCCGIGIFAGIHGASLDVVSLIFKRSFDVI